MSAATSRPRARKKPFNLEKTITKLRKVGRRSVPMADHGIPSGLQSVITGGFGPDGPVDNLNGFADFDAAVNEAKADPDFYVPKSELRSKVSTFFYRLGRVTDYVIDRIGGIALKAVDRYESR